MGDNSTVEARRILELTTYMHVSKPRLVQRMVQRRIWRREKCYRTADFLEFFLTQRVEV